MAAIEVRHLSKRFGSVTAVADVTFSVEPGTTLGLLGPNGAGKTRLVRLLTTLIEPDNGSATVLGHHIVRDACQVRSVIGLAGQYAAVDELLTAADRRVGTYSGGMRRRLDVGPALIGEAPVLFLDEPTTGLDPRTRNDLWEFDICR